jgi:hypothetical protein
MEMDKSDIEGRVSISEAKQPENGPSELEWTEDEERAIRRKLDCRLIPVAFVLFLLCYIDRANIGYIQDNRGR